jgi:hypothetical protein
MRTILQVTFEGGYPNCDFHSEEDIAGTIEFIGRDNFSPGFLVALENVLTGTSMPQWYVDENGCSSFLMGYNDATEA